MPLIDKNESSASLSVHSFCQDTKRANEFRPITNIQRLLKNQVYYSANTQRVANALRVSSAMKLTNVQSIVILSRSTNKPGSFLACPQSYAIYSLDLSRNTLDGRYIYACSVPSFSWLFSSCIKAQSHIVDARPTH